VVEGSRLIGGFCFLELAIASNCLRHSRSSSLSMDSKIRYASKFPRFHRTLLIFTKLVVMLFVGFMLWYIYYIVFRIKDEYEIRLV